MHMSFNLEPAPQWAIDMNNVLLHQIGWRSYRQEIMQYCTQIQLREEGAWQTARTYNLNCKLNGDHLLPLPQPIPKPVLPLIPPAPAAGAPLVLPPAFDPAPIFLQPAHPKFPAIKGAMYNLNAATLTALLAAYNLPPSKFCGRTAGCFCQLYRGQAVIERAPSTLRKIHARSCAFILVR
ncbi:hypothetical protein MVEN_02502700 [Mycena venus]|uniref:Uncharacterized protein n=1 Tax=Mycena venus TaxID=2733690 RepID=A0A8H6U2Z4_9AGAR|nr:hypothetical protein MVEN_02502700 [Mycena venus]